MLCRGRFPCLTVLVTLALLGLLAPAAAADSPAPAQRVAAAWGFADHGQLGATTNRTCRVLYDRLPCSPVPLQVSGLGRVRAVAAGAEHSLALLSDGTVWAWGWNLVGQLGTPDVCVGEFCYSTSPVPVSGLSNVVAIAAGNFHSVAALADGSVWAWGGNDSGALGDGTTIDRNVPVQAVGVSGVTTVAAGLGYTLALKRDGTVLAWGVNDLGELGDGTTHGSSLAVPVKGLRRVAAISAGRAFIDTGGAHSLAIVKAPD